MSAVQWFGWLSSALIIVSLMQARVLRFRLLNLAGAALATVVNALLGVWPFAAMNAVITVIDVYWVWRLSRERHDAAVYEVVQVGVQDAYLGHVLAVHAKDVAATHPQWRGLPNHPGAAEPGRSAFLVLHGDETVGVVLVADAGSGVGRVEVDYVTPRFRDFTPGEFVYRRSGVFAGLGFTELIADPPPTEQAYFARVGFRPTNGHWQRSVEHSAA